MQQTLNPLERHLINRFQGDVAFAERPFRQMAEELGSNEETVFQSVQRLLERGWLSRFGPLYNAERLGGSLVLAAMSVPDGY
ncbi:MAG: AsnC family protein, partial [gamma proteobacterium symbiont of Ctena orbiculata]